MNRLGKVSILCAALCVALAAMAVGAAAAKPHGGKGAKKEKPTVARLDPSFGTGGTTTVATPKPFNEEGREIDPSTHTAVAPSDKSYVLQGQTVVGFGADGKPDQKFGTHGRVTVKPGPGLVISVNGIAVDSRGRVLVAGTYEPTPGFKNPIAKGTDEPLYFGNSAATEAFVTRYLPTGRPDPTFGSGGTAITALGVPVPNNQPEAEKPATAEYERPIVTITAVGVDSGDRPVLAGAYVYAEKTCIHKQEFTRSIVARLTASGGIDTSFGNGGFSVIPGEKAFALARGPHGEWAAFGQRERGCYNDLSPFYSDLAVVSEAGTGASLSPATPTPVFQGAVAVDGQGRIVYAEEGAVEELAGTPVQAKITRLLPDGEVDRSFGHEGGIVLDRFDPGHPKAVAVDARERIVVGLAGAKKFELARLTSAGKLEGRFGDHGLLSGPKNGAELQGVTIDSKGRIVASGYSAAGATKTGVGVTVARFLPGK